MTEAQKKQLEQQLGVIANTLLRKKYIGRSNYYINTALYSILTKEYDV